MGINFSNCEPFNLFGLGPHPMVEGLVLKKPRVAVLIKIAAYVVLGLTIALYVMFARYLVQTNALPVALGAIAFMTVYFLVMWRAIPYYKVVIVEHFAMGPPDVVDAATETLPSKMSTLV